MAQNDNDSAEYDTEREAITSIVRLPRALDMLSTLVYVADRNGCLIDANATMFNLIGCSRENALGRTIHELLGEPGNDQADNQSSDSTGIPRKGVLRSLVAPDTLRWFQCDHAPVTTPDGNFVGYIGTLSDVTEQIRLRNELEERQRHLSYITDNTADILWTMDLDFNTSYVSPSVERLLGFTPEERRSQSLEEMVTPASLTLVLKTLQEELAREAAGAAPDRSLVVEVEYYCKDGSTRWLENMVTPMRNADGSLTGMLGVSRDISELRRARAELEKSESRMRELAAYLQDVRERERTDIARDLHDQIGQALTALGLDLYILRQAIEKDSDTSRQIMNRITATVDGLTNDARTLATELRPGMLDDLGLGPTIEWQIDQFKMRSGLQCTFDLNCEEEELPQRYSTALFRALQELLRNVLRHARARTVHVELGIRSGCVGLTVSDDGRGITPEEIHGSQSLGFLGLTEQIRLLGGSVDISGTEGAGTAVFVSLPLEERLCADNPAAD